MRAYCIKKDTDLKKHVAAIHSSGHLTLLQRKIANALLYNAYEDLLNKEEHQIHIMELSRLIGYDSKDQKKIKEALIALISTVIQWNIIDQQIGCENIWSASAIISDASIQGAICKYSYSKRMKQLLYRPDFYGRINMNVLSKFKSTYGLALYENCIRYQDIGHTARFTMEIFRKLMGVEESQYLIFRDFKKRVLDKAITEVNRYSPINVTVKFEKEGAKVTTIQFFITKINNEKIILPSEHSLINKLRDEYGFAVNKIAEMLAKYGEPYIMEKITIIEALSSYKTGQIANLAQYLAKALKENYQAPKSSKEQINKIKRTQEQQELERKYKDQKRIEYRDYYNKQIYQIYQNLPENDKAVLHREFDQHIKPTIYYSLFIRDGIENPLVKDHLCDFIRKKKFNYISEIKTFDEFAKM